MNAPPAVIAAPAVIPNPSSVNVNGCTGSSTSDAVAVNVISVSSGPPCGAIRSSTGATLTLPTVTVISSEALSVPSDTMTSNV